MARTKAIDNATPDRFNPLFEANYNAVYRYCVRRLGTLDAEDAAADVFAVAWRRIAEMPSGEASRAWLFGVAYRVIGNEYRSRRRQKDLAGRLAALGTGPDPHELFESSSSPQIECLYEALDGLRPADRELLRLWSWDGLTRAEIAHVLHLTETAVDQRLHRARSRLRTRFERLHRLRSPQEPEEAST